MSLNKSFSRSQHGITIVETLLALSVAAIMLTMLAYWMRSASDDMRAKRNADSLLQFTQIASHYLDANRDGIIRAMNGDATEAGRYCILNADPVAGTGGTTKHLFDNTTDPNNWKALCAVDASWLVWKKLLPSGYALTNPYGQKWVAIYRLVYAKYDGTNITQQGDVEMLVVATGGNATPNDELGMAIQLAGGVGGMYPDSTNSPVSGCPADSVCGPGGWRATLSNFVF